MNTITKSELDNILASAIDIYRYGSFVYGTNDENSDEDFLVVVPKTDEQSYDYQVELDNKQYTIRSEDVWQERLNNYEVDVIEALDLPPDMIVKETKKYWPEGT